MVTCRDCGTEYPATKKAHPIYCDECAKKEKWEDVRRRRKARKRKEKRLKQEREAKRERELKKKEQKKPKRSQPRKDKKQSKQEKLCNMPYKKYLQTSHWKKTRKQALKRAKGKCENCGKEDILHVHHLNYDRVGEEKTSDLVVLCRSCHHKTHSSGQPIDKITPSKGSGKSKSHYSPWAGLHQST